MPNIVDLTPEELDILSKSSDGLVVRLASLYKEAMQHITAIEGDSWCLLSRLELARQYIQNCPITQCDKCDEWVEKSRVCVGGHFVRGIDDEGCDIHVHCGPMSNILAALEYESD